MKSIITFLSIIILVLACKTEPKKQVSLNNFSQISNVLNFNGTPKSAFDKKMLMFSDQGAWFAYSFPDTITNYGGFCGPFLMTQQNGVWSSSNLSQLVLKDVVWNMVETTSYASHLQQVFKSEKVELTQQLVFSSGHSAMIHSKIKNVSNRTIKVSYHWRNQPILADGIEILAFENEVTINSSKTNAIGHLIFPKQTEIKNSNNNYSTVTEVVSLKPNQTKDITISQSFIFPEYSWEKENQTITTTSFKSILSKRIIEKEQEVLSLNNNLKSQFKDSIYKQVLEKSYLTLQNNWRIAAGELKFEGLFPSYHYKWFHGFWSWDSWKHAVGLSYYNTSLAKNQIRALFNFQKDDGFIVDCIYRDTTIEPHNFRDTKPPLSAWAVAKIFRKDADTTFVKELYPKLKKYHNWWYQKRDFDKDSLCEYGSTDGSLIAAKWESGMDNAIRFDNAQMLKIGEDAYTLNQESVDLNAYLYAEKLYLAMLAEVLNLNDDVKIYKTQAKKLKTNIQKQFFDSNDGWFYDTNIEGNQFIKGEGSEGWTALWANAASQSQATAVKNKLMNPLKFYTKVPFQTMSADHPKFDPLKGYWRGPNWLDQAYFGVEGLRNYGFEEEANKATKQILSGAEGILDKGTSIRENYHPITGEGLNAKNFSWSAAHIIMLLTD
jgi:putative isomerase